jgi:hypothetical protein
MVLALLHGKVTIMPLINLLVILVLFGIALYFINMIPWIEAKVKRIINVVAVVGIILWVLAQFDLLSTLTAIRVG